MLLDLDLGPVLLDLDVDLGPARTEAGKHPVDLDVDRVLLDLDPWPGVSLGHGLACGDRLNE